MRLFRRRGSKDLFQIPQPVPASGPFRLTVEDVFVIPGRGTVVTGTVETGTVSVDDRATVERGGKAVREVEIHGIELFRKRRRRASAGETVGLLLHGVERGDVARADVIRSP
jgi:elongation factor Tu